MQNLINTPCLLCLHAKTMQYTYQNMAYFGICIFNHVYLAKSSIKMLLRLSKQITVVVLVGAKIVTKSGAELRI